MRTKNHVTNNRSEKRNEDHDSSLKHSLLHAVLRRTFQEIQDIKTVGQDAKCCGIDKRFHLSSNGVSWEAESAHESMALKFVSCSEKLYISEVLFTICQIRHIIDLNEKARQAPSLAPCRGKVASVFPFRQARSWILAQTASARTGSGTPSFKANASYWTKMPRAKNKRPRENMAHFLSD